MDPREVTAYAGESALTGAATRISSEPEEHKSDAEIATPAPAFHDFWFFNPEPFPSVSFLLIYLCTYLPMFERREWR